ncbi:MAG: hypothetical protein LBS91_00490 [Clostridiales Family XIII bacterium]|nr:hypothetical protein [Clostridiales Family XIII bacterium]
MGKVGKILLIFIPVMCVAAFVIWPFFRPELSAAAPELAADGKGGVYLAENRSAATYLYRVGQDGKVDAALNDKVIHTGGANNAGYGFVTQIAAMDGKVYYIREFTDNDPHWTLLVADAALGSSQELFTGDYNLVYYIKSLSTDGAHLLLTGISTDVSSIQVLSLPLSAEEATTEDGAYRPEVYLYAPLPDDDVVADAVCDGEAIYALLGGGRVERFAVGQRQVVSEAAELIACPSGQVVFADAKSHAVYVQKSTVDFEAFNMQEGTTPLAVTAVGGYPSMLAKQAGGATVLSLQAGDAWASISEPDVSLRAQLSLTEFPPAQILFLILILSAAFILSLLLAVFNGRIAVRTGALFSALGCVLLAVVCAAVWIGVGAVVILEADTAIVESAKEQILSGRSALQSETVFFAFKISGIAFLVALFGACLATWFSLRPLRQLTAQIDRFTEGDFNVDGIVTARGELGLMQSSVSAMGISLSIRKYETDMMVASFFRFVPRGIDQLLGRASIMEISSGDVAAIEDCLAIVSVENRDFVLEKFDNHRFMDFVNDCFSRIRERVLENNGMLLSGDFDLSALPVLFSLKMNSIRGDALRFGLEIINRSNVQEGDGLPPPDFFLMLHKASFLYGVAGTEQKSFAFISSAELNFLRRFNTLFHSFGIRMAATEQYLKELDASFHGELRGERNTRYIGLVSNEDGSLRYKIYEILDCLPERERELRLGYDGKLQEAIRMFYKNEFHEAMAEFYSILRQNPKDGLVRWYVFASERYFHEDDPSKVRYNIVGIED